MFDEGLYKLLTGNAALNTLLGVPRSGGDTGVYPDIAPDEVLLPYVVYTLVHRDTVLTYQGVNAFQGLRYQLACYAASSRSAKLIANAVKSVVESVALPVILADPDETILAQVLPESEHNEILSEFRATTYGTILDYRFLIIAAQGQ